ncbi:MAG: hypothetical protein ACFB0D_04260 [Phormidesmis sp.]
MTSASTLGPLNPGNVVSAALRLCRDRFKTYFGLSLVAVLWASLPIIGIAILAVLLAGLVGPPPVVWAMLLLPSIALVVYGWAKYVMYSGVLARLSFRELINEPETPAQAKQQLQPKMWSFLGLAFLLFIIFLATYFIVAIGGTIVGAVVGGVLGYILNAIFGSGGAIFATVISVILALLGIIFCFVWVFGRVFIAEVPMAVEARTGAGGGISRSWQLTKRSVLRIQFVVLAAFLVTLPAYVVIYAVALLPPFLLPGLEPGSSAYNVFTLVSTLVSMAVNIMLMPFWQAIKGVLYYDLRSRREGLDLTL